MEKWRGTMVISINRYVLDTINLAGILLSVLGFFYLTYELFGRKPLKGFIRVVTPGLVGATILVVVGIPEFAFIVRNAELSMSIRNGILYGLIGGLIGVFNGFFVKWPLVHDKPLLFSWKGSLIGLILMFLVSLVLAFAFNLPPVKGILEASVLAPIGGFAGGLWQFLNWVPSTSPNKAPLYSWRGCLLGLVSAFLFGFVASLVLGRPSMLAFTFAGILTPTGGIVGGLWQFFKKESPSTDKISSVGKKNDLVLNDLPGMRFTKRGILVPKGGSEVDLNLAVLFSIDQASFFSGKQANPALDSQPEMEFTKGGILVPKGRSVIGSLFKESPFTNKAPLFSLRGCLIGLISAFLFGFLFALAVDITFGNALVGSLRAALTAASLIGPAGALTGAISRFIFWRANSLADGQLGGIGAVLTLIGFFLQLLLPLVDLLDIPVR
jgi:hypothetical protein